LVRNRGVWIIASPRPHGGRASGEKLSFESRG
jgi:hypothetical protein